MRLSRQHALLLVLAPSFPTGALCDFSGPSFPAPRDLTSNSSAIKTAWNSVTAALEAQLGCAGPYSEKIANKSGTILQEARNITFSIGLFSVHDPDAIELQFHHTSNETKTSSQGTKKADGNSIYRVASITKVFTVLAGLITLSDEEWERPLSKILAPLAGQADTDTDSVLSTPWAKISTIRPTQRRPPRRLSLRKRNRAANGSAQRERGANHGSPPANASDPLSAPPCLLPVLQGEACTETPYLMGIANRAPTFAPWSAPAYANNGFTLLGLAMAKVTGQAIGTLFQNHILAPLGMASTFSDPPPTTENPRSVIVGPDFAAPNGIFVSSGGVFSTTRDLARLGCGILNSSLLTPDRTSRWLKPVSHTARLQYAVGAPWEIIRHVTSPSNKIVDLYTKSGDSGMYSSWLVLVPEFGFGFTILSAGSAETRFRVVAALADAVETALVPALQHQAVVEAGRNFAGMYRATGGLNTTLVLETQENTPGVIISSWVSNGTDVFPFLASIFGPGPYRLLPSMATNNNTHNLYDQHAFRLVGARDSPALEGSESGALFSSPGMAAADWIAVDDTTYYGASMSLFVFDIRRDGRAVGVSIPAYRVSLAREMES